MMQGQGAGVPPLPDSRAGAGGAVNGGGTGTSCVGDPASAARSPGSPGERPPSTATGRRCQN